MQSSVKFQQDRKIPLGKIVPLYKALSFEKNVDVVFKKPYKVEHTHDDAGVLLSIGSARCLESIAMRLR